MRAVLSNHRSNSTSRIALFEGAGILASRIVMFLQEHDHRTSHGQIGFMPRGVYPIACRRMPANELVRNAR